LHSPGVGLLTGEAGVGKTAALRHLVNDLNPHRYQVIYLSETDFGRLDLYRSLPLASRLSTGNRKSGTQGCDPKKELSIVNTCPIVSFGRLRKDAHQSPIRIKGGVS
jgi:hypothetical protein